MTFRIRPLNARSRASDSFLAIFLFVVGQLAVAMCTMAQQHGGEIDGALSGGRAIVPATRETFTFIAIDEPVEPGSPPPRVMTLDSRHVAVLRSEEHTSELQSHSFI